MLDDSLVFHKTARGAEELAGTARQLSARLRRGLILVDGTRSVAELSSLVRPGEVDAILEELQAGGYIALEGGARADDAGTAPASPQGEPARAPAPEEFLAVRQRATREVYDRLGPDGDTLALRIDRCRTPDELRVALRDAERILSEFLGPEAGRTFARKVGRDLKAP